MEPTTVTLHLPEPPNWLLPAIALLANYALGTLLSRKIYRGGSYHAKLQAAAAFLASPVSVPLAGLHWLAQKTLYPAAKWTVFGTELPWNGSYTGKVQRTNPLKVQFNKGTVTLPNNIFPAHDQNQAKIGDTLHVAFKDGVATQAKIA